MWGEAEKVMDRLWSTDATLPSLFYTYHIVPYMHMWILGNLRMASVCSKVDAACVAAGEWW